jgi:hypothetical protein
MTAIDVLNQYPSTDDLPPIMGAQDDHCLAILTGARRRYKANGTNDAYIESDPEAKRVRVCALGAFGASLGITSETDDYLGDLKAALRVDESAKLAINLVNKAARKLYPESKSWRGDVAWSAPIEWLNQEFGTRGRDEDFKKAKKAVLECYDYAIAMRTAGTW